ncbi:putative Amastin surface glycoprotein [Leishmania naiffi]|uniref:Amastin surface glycoprotein n=1 Tax=Leishmania naiffi TaxID=5678 RepID=A0AAW3C034_9TRYP
MSNFSSEKTQEPEVASATGTETTEKHTTDSDLQVSLVKGRIGIIIYVVLQFFAFFFVLFGTPIDMFRLRSGDTSIDRVTVTKLWGLTSGVFTIRYPVNTSRQWRNCPSRLTRFRLAQAFALISIFVYGTAFVLGLILLFCCSYLRWVCLALNIVGAVTLCFVWAAMVVTYYRNESSCLELGSIYNYGAGFVLFLLAWVLDILNIVPLLLPFRLGSKAETVPGP